MSKWLDTQIRRLTLHHMANKGKQTQNLIPREMAQTMSRLYPLCCTGKKIAMILKITQDQILFHRINLKIFSTPLNWLTHGKISYQCCTCYTGEIRMFTQAKNREHCTDIHQTRIIKSATVEKRDTITQHTHMKQRSKCCIGGTI